MKRYLKTPEEVIDALAAGKVVRDEGSQWTLYKGFIMRKDNTFDNWVVNDYILSEYAGLYVDEPKPIEIEVGKFYKTRNGRKAFVYAKTNFDYPYRFCVAMVGNLESYSVNAKGTQSDIEQRPVDLIAPWGNK